MYETDSLQKKAPASLKICDILFFIGVILVIISQFTNLYYTIDADNIYHRSPSIWICYIVPLLMILIQEMTLIKYHSQFNRNLVISLMGSIALPTIASFIQLFFYGLSITNISLVVVVIVFYFFLLIQVKSGY